MNARSRGLARYRPVHQSGLPQKRDKDEMATVYGTGREKGRQTSQRLPVLSASPSDLTEHPTDSITRPYSHIMKLQRRLPRSQSSVPRRSAKEDKE